ncbi:MAG: hypothetical protein K1000chlam1_01332 [Candidatus Anoxychlamydiales bacterium]|nr:hypothetical protein [Candidatus Anoxychlamydiales bacterium]
MSGYITSTLQFTSKTYTSVLDSVFKYCTSEKTSKIFKNITPLGPIIRQFSSEYINYSDALIPGSLLLLGAFGVSRLPSTNRSLLGKLFKVSLILGATALGALHIGHFIWQSGCLAEELKSCKMAEGCHPVMRDGSLQFESLVPKHNTTYPIMSNCFPYA